MTPVQPQKLLHRGVVPAAGFYFDTRLLPEAEARQRVIALWTPGAVVYRLAAGLLLHLPAPQRVRCETAPGLPLVATNGLLLAAPLTAAELHALNAPQGSLIRVLSSAALVVDLANTPQEDPAAWLDVSDWQAVSTTTLGSPPDPIRVVAAPEPFDPRARLQGVPPADPERALVLDALWKAAQNSGAQGAAGSGLGGQMANWLQRLLGKPKTSGTGIQTAATQRSGLGDAARRLTARMLLKSGLARAIGRRQAEYLGNLVEMFERGDLQEALRHAIAMGELKDGQEHAPRPPALGVPTPRNDLTISPRQAPARSAISLVPDFFQHLQELYRQAFRRLEAEGRIEEAAFVLAELLGANEEAVAFLERHQRLRLAAEIAEARHLPTGLVVRQWFLAGEIERAVLIARRTGAFADALYRLERTDRHRARELRLLWAASLAAAGNFAGAIETLQPVMAIVVADTEIRRQIVAWLEQAIALGGPAGARMLAKKVTFCPEDAEAIRAQALTLLAEESPETAPERLAFARALCLGEATPLARSLARAAARSVLRDAASSPLRVDTNDWQVLLRFTDDAALRADAPALPAPKGGLSTRETPLTFSVSSADTGAFPLYDAALLPDGRAVVALGEAGLRLLTRDGRTVVHVDQPAHQLVLSDHSNQVLALAPRGDVWRLARMDLVTRRTEVWREAALRAFAPDYDGSLWFVAIEQDFLAIDATSADFGALWRLPRLEGRVLSIARSGTHCSFLLFSAGVTDTWGRLAGPWTRLERWTHSLPNLFLRDRNEVACPPETAQEGTDYARALTPEGTVYYLNAEPADANLAGPRNLILTDTAKERHPIAPIAADTTLLPPVVAFDWIVVSIRQPSGIECRVLHRKPLTLRAQITLAGATSVSARFTPPTLTLADDRGRLLALDLERGALIRDLRVR